MRGTLIGIAVAIALIGGGFLSLLIMADAMTPEPSEIRVEVTDALAD
ncbi:MAG: hypothetical protein AAFX09_09665 [Pseudomonadota bacterium]